MSMKSSRPTSSHHLITDRQQGTPTAHTPAEVWQAPPVVSRPQTYTPMCLWSCLVAGGTSCCCCGARGPSLLHRVNMSHLSSRVEPHWQMVLHWIATSGMFLGTGLHWIATRTCLGSSSAARVRRRISVLTRGSVGSSAFPSTPMVLKVGALRVVLALVRRLVAVVGTVIRRWCGGRGFVGSAGLQTRMRTAAQWPWRQT